MSDFSEISKSLAKRLDLKTRKAEGIFFTPASIRQKIFDFLIERVFEPKSILEPSCGSGEFIEDCLREFPEADITGVEYNKTIYENIKDKFNNIYNQDFLEFKSSERYDLIIGNPPYFITTKKNKECMTGKGNIFVLFIYKCITEHLANKGYLAFVLPTSFYNSKDYEPCRKYIQKNMNIVYLENVDGKYIDTSQPTMIMILQNKKINNEKYILSFSENVCFSPYYKEINELLVGSKTLRDLECKVATGTVVWNQHKDKLSDEAGEVIIYSSNIVDNNLVLNNLKGEKKQYIRGYNKEPIEGPALLVTRGYGNSFKMSYVMIEEGFKFFGENHVNVITNKKEVLEMVKRSFEDERTEKFIKYYVGNGAMSKTEIENILPIFLF